MKQLLYSLLLLFTIVCVIPACSKEKDNNGEENTNPPTLEGTYSGSFSRTGMDITNFTITFTGNNFTGSSAGSYPVICNGTFNMNASQVSFTNTCNEPGTIVLNGVYSYTLLRGATFRIWRTNNNNTDEYKLTLNR
jgi:hypothetical protein